MRIICLYLIFLLTVPYFGFAQVKKIQQATGATQKQKSPYTKVAVYGGITNSLLILERNIKEQNSTNGYHVGFLYSMNRTFRASVEYCAFKRSDIVPTWYDIKARCTEVNIHALAFLNGGNAWFYPIAGFSYNTFSGYFTGINDHLHLRKIYQVDAEARTNWVGLNLGTGFEFRVKRFSFFGEYKMRIGFTEYSDRRQLSIMDVCFSTGARLNLKVPSVYKIFKGTRSRYLLDKADD